MVNFNCHDQRPLRNISWLWLTGLFALVSQILLVTGQQVCYYGAGASNRGPSNLVPCNGTGTSACCLLGDTCLSGNTCYNFATGNLYQYGCTDINYQDESCPYKCGFDPTRSPWSALEYCSNLQDTTNTWVCHAPESCGCAWNSTSDLLVLEPIGCQEMGSNARVALYAPSTLAPYVSLPSTIGGSTGYYSTTIVSGTKTWVSTAVDGYTPSSFTQLTTYRAAPTSTVLVNAGQTPAPSTYSPARSFTPTSGPAPTATTPSTNPKNSGAATTSSDAGSPSTSSNSTKSSSLSTGAKAGIGVGAAAGVCLFAALAWIIFLLMRKHRDGNQSPQAQYNQGPQYTQSPPMAMEASQYPPGSPWAPYPMTEPTPYHEVPAMYGDETQGPKPMYSPPLSSPASPPVELSTVSDRNRQEMSTDTSAVSSPVPRHAYPHS